MSKSLNDVFVQLRHAQNPNGSVVGITLSIHSQAKNTNNPTYRNHAYFGFGALQYLIGSIPTLGGRPLSYEYLQSSSFVSGNNDWVCTLNDFDYATDKALMGDVGAYQSFIVKGAAAELWTVEIYPQVPFGPYPTSFVIQSAFLNITSSASAQIWSISTSDNAGFLQGIGPDPNDANEKALYSIVFGEISPYTPPVN